MDTNVKKFLQDLLVEAGQTGLPQVVEDQLLEDLNVRLEQKLILVAIDNLSAEKQTELQKMAESGALPDKIMEFLRANIPDIDQVFVKAMQAFRETYLGK